MSEHKTEKARLSVPATPALIVPPLEGRRLGASADGIGGDRRRGAIHALLALPLPAECNGYVTSPGVGEQP